MDSLKTRKLELEILKQYNLPRHKMDRVTKELYTLTQGEKGERNTAYYIDFELKHSPNWVVIHDLRLEKGDDTAQIDHLLINRFLEFYVLETKAFSGTLQMLDDGSFLSIYDKKSYVENSPVSQNNRHIKLLRNILQERSLMPKRLGIPLSPSFESFILLDKTKFIRPNKCASSMVLRSDQFIDRLHKELEEVSFRSGIKQISKVVSQETLRELGANIVALHKKGNINYKELFGITNEDLNSNSTNIASNHEPQKTSNYCAQCKTDIPSVVAKFCFERKARFGGRAYCRDCQNDY